MGAVVLVAPIALLGANAGVAAPDTAAPAGAASAQPGGVDDEAFRHRMIQESAAGAAVEPRPSAEAILVTEQEPARAGGANDRLDSAERPSLSQASRDWELRIDGTLSTETVPPVAIGPTPEDDGAIPLARDLELGDERQGISTTGRIGDGPHGSQGSGTGDYDFYRIDAQEGDTLTADIDPDGELSPNALLYDADGNLVIGAQDMTGAGDVHLSHPIEEDGDYYLAVGSYFPKDPFDPASGPAVITEGPYQLDVTLHVGRTADTDVYAIPLRKGDVLGTTVAGAARRIAVHGSDGALIQASAADVGVIYPDDSPLPRGGNATADHVVDETGLYFLSVSDGTGDYAVTVVSRRAPSTTGERPQTIYLDFSGPTFDNRVFGGAVIEPGIREVSPMRDFLPRWGLESSDEQAVIEATTERVEQMLHEDLPGSEVRVTNSVKHPDLFGQPGVSRVIVGGTVEESGLIPAFGMSESIDPGNFAREDTAIVMPEPMSGDDQPASLNNFLSEDSDRIQAVGQALGNTIGHEAGHFLGNFHTDDHDDHTNVMNTGNLLHMFAIGPDGVAGTADDDRIALGTSRYDPLQGQSGTESTSSRTWLALR